MQIWWDLNELCGSSIFLLCYCTIVTQDVTMKGNWMKGIQDVSVLSLTTYTNQQLSQNKFILKTWMFLTKTPHSLNLAKVLVCLHPLYIWLGYRCLIMSKVVAKIFWLWEHLASKHHVCINTNLNLTTNLVSRYLFLWDNWGTERVSNLSKVVWSLLDKVEIRTQLLSLYSNHCLHFL